MTHSSLPVRFACGILAASFCMPLLALQAAPPAQPPATTPPAKTPPAAPPPAKAPVAAPKGNPPQTPPATTPQRTISEAPPLTNTPPVTVNTQDAVPSRTPQGAQQIDVPRVPASTAQALRIEPSPLDLGDLSPEVAKSGKVKITNITDHPVRITKIQPACGCTTTTVPAGPLQPGESTEIDITIKPPAQGGHPLAKNVSFQVQDHPPQVLTVQGTVKEYVKVTPAVLSGPSERNAAPAPLRIESKDGKPIHLTAATPDIFVALPSNTALVHDIEIDWAKWENQGSPSKISVLTDHPNAPQASFLIKRSITVGPKADARTAQTGLVSPLIIAARDGNVVKVQEALASGERPEATESATGRSALHFASESGNVEVMKALLDAKANPNMPDRLGRSPLAVAAEKGQAKAIEMLIAAGGDINMKDQVGGTALVWASGLGGPQSVEVLLKAGANPEVVDRHGMTPLIWAAGFGKHESVDLLLAKGVQVNTADQLTGDTALFRAIRSGQIESVKSLMKSGAALDVRNNQGMTPLLVACHQGDLAKVKLLLDAGADKSAKDSRGWGAIDFARNRMDPLKAEIVTYIEPIVPASTAVAPPEGTPTSTTGATKGE